MEIDTNRVRQRARGIIVETWRSQANLSFFLALLVLAVFVLPALGIAKDDIRLYGDISFSVLLCSGVAIAWGDRKLFLLAGFVAIAAITVRWMSWMTPTPAMELWSNLWSLAAILLIAAILLRQVFRPGPVTAMRIQGAIATYLMFGLGWANAFHIAALLNPGSIRTATGSELSTVSEYVYFSFATLSTVGYGDVVAVGQVARSLAIGEAIAGQLYLAVLIARLVAMEVLTWQQQESDRKSEQR